MEVNYPKGFFQKYNTSNSIPMTIASKTVVRTAYKKRPIKFITLNGIPVIPLLAFLPNEFPLEIRGGNRIIANNITKNALFIT
tara:strand:- start:116 stop:364 length:249 start_codon:yes stop_codon:yes gene_type:complete